MPSKPCRKPGCSNLVDKYDRNGLCKYHKSKENAVYDATKRNQEHRKFYNSTAWKRLSARVKLEAFGLCQYNNCGRPGNLVHHIVPLAMSGEGWEKRLDRDNLIYVCSSCHELIHDRLVFSKEDKGNR